MSTFNKKLKLAGAKIRPVTRRQDANQFDDAWTKLSTAIKEIYRKNASILSFEELYR